MDPMAARRHGTAKYLPSLRKLTSGAAKLLLVKCHHCGHRGVKRSRNPIKSMMRWVLNIDTHYCPNCERRWGNYGAKERY